MEKLDRTQTGLAGEFFVAAELFRRGFNVAMTFGNTKAIDLLAEKDGKEYSIQVKAIQRTASITFNLKRENVKEHIIYIFVNIHSDTLEMPEFFILKGTEVSTHLKHAKSGRDWIDYNYLNKHGFKDKWEKFD